MKDFSGGGDGAPISAWCSLAHSLSRCSLPGRAGGWIGRVLHVWVDTAQKGRDHASRYIASVHAARWFRRGRVVLRWLLLSSSQGPIWMAMPTARETIALVSWFRTRSLPLILARTHFQPPPRREMVLTALRWLPLWTSRLPFTYSKRRNCTLLYTFVLFCRFFNQFCDIL